jgi:hypothetical protein
MSVIAIGDAGFGKAAATLLAPVGSAGFRLVSVAKNTLGGETTSGGWRPNGSC